MKTLTKKILVFATILVAMLLMTTTYTVAQKSGNVQVCHNGNTISVSGNALNAHLAHGDVVGPCSNSCIDPNLIDPNWVCIALYDPVCGCDGITYSNGCVATFGYGVTSYTPGECNNNCIGTPQAIFCPTVVIPVCGCDGQTYSNSCFATAAGILSYVDGACSGSTGKMIGAPAPGTQILPNPAQDHADLRWTTQQDEIAQVDVLNAVGQVVSQSGPIATTKGAASSFRIDVSQLAPGVYIARLQHGDVSTTHRLVVQH